MTVAGTQKRVLLVSTVHPVDHPRYWNKIARAFAESEWELELYARGEQAGELPGEPILHLLTPRRKLGRLLDLPKVLLRMLTGGHDLIVVVPPECVPLGLLAKLAGRTVAWDVEEDARATLRHSEWIPALLRRPLSRLYSLVERLAARSFDAVTLAEEAYRPRFSSARRVEVIHNYPPFDPEAPDLSRGEAARRRWASPGPKLVYVGQLMPQRGALEAIEALRRLEAKLPDIELRLLGSIPDPLYRRRLEQARAKLQRPERVELAGQVPFALLNEHLARAQIGLLPLHPTPNYRDSQPTKIFEYALAGLPMVVGDRPAWRTIVDGAGAGEVFAAGDSQALARAIEALWARGAEQLEALGVQARRLVLERGYLWEEEARTLLRLMEEIRASGPQR